MRALSATFNWTKLQGALSTNFQSLDYRLSKGHNGLRCTGNTYWDSIKSAQKPSLSPTFAFPRVSATDKDTANTAEQQIRPFLRSPPATVEGSITERTRGGPILAVRDRESERDLKRSVRSCPILVLLRGCEEGNPCPLRPSVRRIKTSTKKIPSHRDLVLLIGPTAGLVSNPKSPDGN
ncbi:hypothetical protein V1478_008220 [Vespula squamosa]|uniref:Uncharacterized protein n=1 Tax=Vespula squamosa TaxID=30214 RepID=A0ABD2AY63_VESSQ